MFFKIVIMCFVFIDIPSAIYSFKHPPSVKKQLEIITTKVQEHVATILQPLEGLDDSRRAELKAFAKTISDTYNEMAVKLQIQIENFLETYATMSTDIEFGTMFNDPMVGSKHKEPIFEGDNQPTPPYSDDSDSLVAMVRSGRTTPSFADEDDLFIPNEPSVTTVSPKSSEETDGNGEILFKTPAANNARSQGRKASQLPLYYDGGKQQYYTRNVVPDNKKSGAKDQQKVTKKMTSSEEERHRDQNEEKKLQEQKYRRRTSSEEDREKEDKLDNGDESTPTTTVLQSKTPLMTSSEEEDLNPMTKKKLTTEMPQDSSEEVKPTQRKIEKKRKPKKTTPTVATKKVKRTTKRHRPASINVKKVRKYRPTKMSWIGETYDPSVMYPEDSAKEEED